MRIFEYGYEVVPKGFTDDDRRTMENGEIGAFSWLDILTGWRVGLPLRWAIVTKVRASRWWLEWKLRKWIERMGYRRNGLKHKLRAKIICMGLTKGTAYYVSALHGNDENSGLRKSEALFTYDEAQGRIHPYKPDIIVVLDWNSTTYAYPKNYPTGNEGDASGTISYDRFLAEPCPEPTIVFGHPQAAALYQVLVDNGVDLSPLMRFDNA